MENAQKNRKGPSREEQIKSLEMMEEIFHLREKQVQNVRGVNELRDGVNYSEMSGEDLKQCWAVSMLMFGIHEPVISRASNEFARYVKSYCRRIRL